MSDQRKANIGLILGIISIFASIIPLFGIPLGILGIVYSLKDKEESKGKLTAGLVCSIIGLTLSTLNSILGAYVSIKG